LLKKEWNMDINENEEQVLGEDPSSSEPNKIEASLEGDPEEESSPEEETQQADAADDSVDEVVLEEDQDEESPAAEEEPEAEESLEEEAEAETEVESQIPEEQIQEVEELPALEEEQTVDEEAESILETEESLEEETEAETEVESQLPEDISQEVEELSALEEEQPVDEEAETILEEEDKPLAEDQTADVPTEEAEIPLEVETEEEQEEITEETPERKPVAVPAVDDGRAWYVVHCYSGNEDKVRFNIVQRIESMGMDDLIFDVVVPTEDEVNIKNGERQTIEKKVFPGYILVNMILTEESWYMVRNTPGVTGFVGMGNDPTPLQPEEVARILKRMESESPRINVTFRPGERVRIVDGPFEDFYGKVSEIDMERATVRVMVNFFGRETPVELDFLQVEEA
jgi:transcriptional antiterminator NusG